MQATIIIENCKLIGKKPQLKALGNRSSISSLSLKKFDSPLFLTVTQTPIAPFKNCTRTQYSHQPISLLQCNKLFNRSYATKPPTNPQKFDNKQQNINTNDPTHKLETTQTNPMPRTAKTPGALSTLGLTIAKQTAIYGATTAIAFELIKSYSLINFPTMPLVEAAMVYGAVAGTTLSVILLTDRVLVDQKVLSTLSSEILRKMNLSGMNTISAKELKKIFEVDLRKYLDTSSSWRNFMLFNGVSFVLPRFDSVYDSLSRKLADKDIDPRTSGGEILVTGLLEGVVRSQLLGMYDRLFYLGMVLYIILFIVAVAVLYTSTRAKAVYGKVKDTVSERVQEISDQKDVLVDKAAAGMKMIGEKKDNLADKAAAGMKVIGEKKDNLTDKAMERKNQLVSKMEGTTERAKEQAATTKDKIIQTKDKIVDTVKEKVQSTTFPHPTEKNPNDVGVIDNALGSKKVEFLAEDDYRNKNYAQLDEKNPETWNDPNVVQTNYPLALEKRAEEIAQRQRENIEQERKESKLSSK